jgi:hypoxanthine phosphoribosyltransferase
MKKYISEKDFDSLLFRIIDTTFQYKDKFNFVVGIKNGGLNISVPLAEDLKLPHQSIHISFYNGEEKMNSPVISSNDLPRILSMKQKIGGPFLWVDDIIDSGSTLQWFLDYTGLKMGKDFYVATLHWCKENSPNLQPNFYVELKDKRDWIVYPWEFVIADV